MKNHDLILDRKRLLIYHFIQGRHTQPYQQLWNGANLNQVGEFALQVPTQLLKVPAHAQRLLEKQTNFASETRCSKTFLSQTECHMVIYESWRFQGRTGAAVMPETYLGNYKTPTPAPLENYLVFKATGMVEESKTFSYE